MIDPERCTVRIAGERKDAAIVAEQIDGRLVGRKQTAENSGALSTRHRDAGNARYRSWIGTGGKGIQNAVLGGRGLKNIEVRQKRYCRGFTLPLAFVGTEKERSIFSKRAAETYSVLLAVCLGFDPGKRRTVEHKSERIARIKRLMAKICEGASIKIILTVFATMLITPPLAPPNSAL